MARDKDVFPETEPPLFLARVGMETDLLFTQGVDLPGFAAYTLLESEEGRGRLRDYYETLIALGRSQGTGVILESPTWVANRDRGADIGYGPERPRALNEAAIALMAEVRAGRAISPSS